jgi:hypothetical protein
MVTGLICSFHFWRRTTLRRISSRTTTMAARRALTLPRTSSPAVDAAIASRRAGARYVASARPGTETRPAGAAAKWWTPSCRLGFYCAPYALPPVWLPWPVILFPLCVDDSLLANTYGAMEHATTYTDVPARRRACC